MCMYKIYMNIEYIVYDKIGLIKSANFREKGGEIRRMIQKYNYA